MKRKVFFAILFVLLIAGALAGIKTLQFRKMIAAASAGGPPPETVSSTVAHEEHWQRTLTAIGSITAVQGVTVTPELPGKVTEIAFESGAVVARSNLLVRLDTSAEEAQLRAVKAQLDLARINLKRTQELREAKTVPQADLDAAEATMQQLQGNADAIQAAIDKKTIRAPFAGQLGIRQVNLGQYLDTGKPVVSLQALSPVYAEFALPQQDVALLQTGMKVRVSTDAYPGQRFEGTLTAINPDLDATTRSVGLQATLANADRLLRPGMFGRIEVLLPEETPVLVIPATAVLSAPFGDSVYVIEPQTGKNGKPLLAVRQQFIRTGQARGDFVAVDSGLKPGERVVSSGLFKLRNGMAVVENNELAPKASETPKPADS